MLKSTHQTISLFIAGKTSTVIFGNCIKQQLATKQINRHKT